MQNIYKAETLSQFPKLIHGFTTRDLANDYDRIAQEINVLPSQIYALKQFHSTEIVCLDHDMDLVHVPPGDAYITERKDVIVGVKTADCVPILIYDVKKDVVAAIHAGYKGMIDGIIQNAVHMMTDHMGSHVADMYVGVGPCISVDHYEVGPEIIEAVVQTLGKQACYQTFPAARPHLDLKSTVRNVLDGLGIHPDHVSCLDYCTFERDDLFFSHRRNPVKERQFSFIGMIS